MPKLGAALLCLCVYVLPGRLLAQTPTQKPFQVIIADIPNHGVVQFSLSNNWDKRWIVQGDLNGLPPSAILGMHVHEYGDIGGGCAGAGGHYNPHLQKHGGRDSAIRHVGDLGNIFTDGNGDASFAFTDSLMTQFIAGRALVIHAGSDDLGQQANMGSMATGNAGARLACARLVWRDPQLADDVAIVVPGSNAGTPANTVPP